MTIQKDVVWVYRGPLGYFGVAQIEGGYKALGAKPTLRALLELSIQEADHAEVRLALQAIRAKAEELRWNDHELEKHFPAR
jgi:hypothetical protein